jgi:aldehyde:ferredoxin oxidoreductase
MYGYWGKILWVDLTSKETWTEEFDEAFARKWLGGAGFGVKLLYDNMPAGADPLGPDNIFFLGVGPIQGKTGVLGSGRFTLSFKSPLTGFWACSTGGGHLAEALKKAGWDAIAVKGASNDPVYLHINEDNIEIKDASALWGKDIRETQDALREEVGDEKAQIIPIGQACENLVKYAAVCIEDGHGNAGRMGGGAVMGSKKLKGIVIQGDKRNEVKDPEKLKEIKKEVAETVKANDFTTANREEGQAMAVIEREQLSLLPMKNFGLGTWADGAKKIGSAGGDFNPTLNPKPDACSNCIMGCHRSVKIEEGGKYDMVGYGPEYETLGMMGSNALIDDLKAINYAGHLCNMYAVDTIDFGGVLGFAMEAYEKNFIKEEDLGFTLEWGDGDAMIKLLDLIVFKKNDMGKLLAEGVEVAANELGCPDLAVTVNNSIIPAHDGRAFFSMAVNYATGPRGPCHVTGFSEGSELGVPMPYYDLPGMDRFDLDLKGKAAMAWQDMSMFDNSLTYCLFYDFAGYSHEWKADIINAITGWDITSTECLVDIGGRICQLVRMFNLKHGFIPTKNDTLPPRMFQPLSEGGAAGKVPPFKKMLAEYYDARGWVNGVPKRETLKRFGLEDTIGDMKDFPVFEGIF